MFCFVLIYQNPKNIKIDRNGVSMAAILGYFLITDIYKSNLNRYW